MLLTPQRGLVETVDKPVLPEGGRNTSSTEHDEKARKYNNSFSFFFHVFHKVGKWVSGIKSDCPAVAY